MEISMKNFVGIPIAFIIVGIIIGAIIHSFLRNK